MANSYALAAEDEEATISAPYVVVEPGQEGYPEGLNKLVDPPTRLYVAGHVPHGHAVAIVGARAANHQGIKLARRLSEDLAREGICIVSGGARGIDQASHRGALEGGGKTVMVLGCGFDVDYPKGSGELREKVIRSGALLSELPLDAPPRPAHFPRRNRLIAGLVQAVIVVQAGQKSGALVTAKLAQKAGRMVMAVPGIPNSPLTRGTHGLLREGAVLVEHAGHVAEALGIKSNFSSTESGSDKVKLKGLGAQIAKWLAREAASPDELARGLKKPIGEIMTTLIELEIQGVVLNHGGCYELSC